MTVPQVREAFEHLVYDDSDKKIINQYRVCDIMSSTSIMKTISNEIT